MAFEILELPRVLESDIQSILLNQRRANLNFKALRAALGSGGTLGTAGRIPYYDANGNLTSIAGLAFDATTLSLLSASSSKALIASFTDAAAFAVGTEATWRTIDLRNSASTASASAGIAAQAGSQRTGGIVFYRNGSASDSGGTKLLYADGSGAYVVGLTLDQSGAVAIPGTLGITGATTLTGGAVFAGGGTNLNHYEEGTFTFTATGMTTSPTGTAKYIRIGKSVTLMFPSISGTSNTTAFTLTGLPSAIQPTTSQEVKLPWVQNNSTDSIAGSANVTSSGTVTLSLNDNPIGWTAALGKGIAAASTVSYLLT